MKDESPWKYEPAGDMGMTTGEALRSTKREQGLINTLTANATWLCVRSYLGLWHRLSVRGREHLPAEGPMVIVANHCSHLDALTLAAALPIRLRADAHPVAADDTFFNTKATTLLAAMLLNALPMRRKGTPRHAMQDLRRRITKGNCVLILFPEGTRSRDGQMADFKTGLGMLVAETKTPIVPAYLDGAHAALPPGNRLPRPAKLRLSFGPPLIFEKTDNGRDGWKSATHACEAAVKALQSST